MTTNANTAIEQANQEVENEQGQQQEQEQVPGYIKTILDNQKRLENQQESLRRQLKNAERNGPAPNPALLKTVANVEQMLADNKLEQQIKELDMTVAQANWARKAAKEKTATEAAEPDATFLQQQAEAAAEGEFEDHLLPKFMQAASLAGFDLNEAMQNEVRADFANFELHVDPKTGAFKNMHEFEMRTLARIAKTAETMQEPKETPAQKAGKTLGEGGRGSGGAPAPKVDFFKTSSDQLMRLGLEQDRQRK